MSIEKTLERIATALEAIATEIGGSESTPAPTPAPAQTPATTPAPAATPSPEPPEVVNTAVPFTDQAGLKKYVMDSYSAMGPEKGVKIGGILTDMGLSDITQVKPEQYEEFVKKIELLKVS